MALIGHVDEISRAVIQGWAIDTDHQDATVAISILVDGEHRGMCLTSYSRDDLLLPDGSHVSGKRGFHFAFDPPLSPFVESRIDVVETWSAQALPNGSCILPRPRSHAGDAPGITPILLTSTGRSGTTLLMSEFARHPDLVVGDRFPYEIKQIAYHAAAFRALAAGADWERSTAPDTMLAPEMHRIVGGNPYNLSGLFDLGGTPDALREFYQSTMPSGYATLFRRFIVEFYATLANAQGKPAAPYFCEKGGIEEAAGQGARLFFETVKDIVVVRDPRDLLCSAIAFWKLRPDEALTMLATTIPRLARLARHAGPDTIVIRYEDLVREPVHTRRAMSCFLDLDLTSDRAAAAEPIPHSHRTSPDPISSIGRWRNELTPDQVAACETVFAPYIRDFDYALSAPPYLRARFQATRSRAPGNRIVAAEGALAVAAFAEDHAADHAEGLASRRVSQVIFGREGTGEIFAREGWSFPERGFVWSNAIQCLVRLPPIRCEGRYRLHIVASPFTHGTALPAQRVTILLNGLLAGTARVRDICVLSVPIPDAVSRSDQPIALTLRFPDAARPSDILATDDSRILGFSLHRIAVFQVEPAPHPANEMVRQRIGRSRSGPDHEAVPRRSEPRPASDEALAKRLTELSRAAFKRKALEYHGRTVLRHIPGYDAARFVGLILALEAEFGIELHEDEVDQIDTMGDILAVLRARLSHHA